MKLGGPVWHCSVAAHVPGITVKGLEAEARRQLEGVGDAQLGEWVQQGEVAVHVRRRLSADEQHVIGDVVDIRKDPDEVSRRLADVIQMGILPSKWRE